MKKTLSLILTFVICFALFACNNNNNSEKTDVTVLALAGPTGMGMAKLMEDKANSANNYDFKLFTAPDQVKAEVANGNFDIAAMPTNLAAVLYNKIGGFKICAVNTLGVLYILENGNTLNSVEDLRGKTIGATGQGSTPEYVLRFVLSANNIDPDNDVTIQFYAEHSELASQMVAGNVDIAMIPQPNVTSVLTTAADFRVALDMTEEWNKCAPDSSLMQGCIVVKDEFAQKNPEALKAFMDEYKKSVEYMTNTENLDAAAELIKKHGIVANAAIAKKALPECNITFVVGEEMKTKLSGFFKVLFEANAASVGGKLPDENIYFTK